MLLARYKGRCQLLFCEGQQLKGRHRGHRGDAVPPILIS